MNRKVKWILLACAFAGIAIAQTRTLTGVQHVNFNSPEGWALKYFTSATIMSGLQPPEPLGERPGVGSITLGLESDWLPTLSAERARVGFTGRKEEDLNKAPILVRPSIRVALPWRFTVVASAPPPFETFGLKPRLFALGFERPIVERESWTLGGRISGQLGSVKGAFTCPERALGSPAGSPQNPTGCIAQSGDEAHLRYAGAELQFAYRIPKMRRLSPHVAEGINYVNSMFQVDAPLERGLDRTRLWTRGTTYTTTAGVSYLWTDRIALTVDTFYTPLSVQRDANQPRVIDGLFNVRALVSYRFR